MFRFEEITVQHPLILVFDWSTFPTRHLFDQSKLPRTISQDSAPMSASFCISYSYKPLNAANLDKRRYLAFVKSRVNPFQL